LGLSKECLAPTVDNTLLFVVPVGTDFVRDDSSITARPQRGTEYSITPAVITIRISRIEKVDAMFDGSANGVYGQFVRDA
jgi:hypothetical protein